MNEISSSQSSTNSFPSSSQLDRINQKFIIPKKRTGESLLVDLETENSLYKVDKEIIETKIKESYFDKTPDLKLGYNRIEFKKISNKNLEDNYLLYLNKKKSELDANKKKYNIDKDLKLYKKWLFFSTENEQSVLDISKNGFQCFESNIDDHNVLGSSKYGIHFSKHIDLTLLYKYFKKTKLVYVIVVKAFFLKYCVTQPNPIINKDTFPDPTRGVDTSSQIPNKNQDIKLRYYNSLIYMFDANEFGDVLDKPNNLLPYAILKYQINSIYDSSLYGAPIKIRPMFQKKQKFQAPLLESIQLSKIVPKQKPCPLSKRKDFIIDKNQNKPELIIEKIVEPSEAPVRTAEVEHATEQEKENSESESESEQEKEDEEDWGQFFYNYYMENYNDVVQELHQRPPRWRVLYERTGRLDVKFKGVKQMTIKIDNILNTKIKFLDPEKTRINLKDPTNNLILTYQNKRFKNPNFIQPNNTLPCTSKQAELKETESNKTKQESDTIKLLKKDPNLNANTNPVGKIAGKSTKPDGLSSEMTSLEKRLLIKPNLISQPKKDSKAPEEEKKTIKEALMKIRDDMLKKKVESAESKSVSTKRKKSFWDPDSDTEYDRLKKAKSFSTKKDLNNFDYVLNDDIVIITRVNLPSFPIIQYSKQYYDLNISGFEAEIKKIDKNSNLIHKKIESVTKTPINPNHYQTSIDLSKRDRSSNKQKFIHYIKMNNLITKFEIDNLKNFKTDSTCLEINSGGFNCIREYKFQNIRRIKSFNLNNSTLGSNPVQFSNSSSSLNENPKKITLNEYKSITPKANKQNENTNPADHNFQSNTNLEKKILSPINSNSNTTLPVQNNTELPSLNLIDEVKKRIKQKEQDEIKKEKVEFSEEKKVEEKIDNSKYSKRKSKHKKSKHHHHKHKKTKKSKKSASSSSEFSSDLSNFSLSSPTTSVSSSGSFKSKKKKLKTKIKTSKSDNEDGEINDEYDLNYDFDLNSNLSPNLNLQSETIIKQEPDLVPEPLLTQKIAENKMEQEVVVKQEPKIEPQIPITVNTTVNSNFSTPAHHKANFNFNQKLTYSAPVQSNDPLQRYHAIMKIGQTTPNNNNNRAFQLNFQTPKQFSNSLNNSIPSTNRFESNKNYETLISNQANTNQVQNQSYSNYDSRFNSYRGNNSKHYFNNSINRGGFNNQRRDVNNYRVRYQANYSSTNRNQNLNQEEGEDGEIIDY